jgi:hypothetical protein
MAAELERIAHGASAAKRRRYGAVGKGHLVQILVQR